MPLMIIIIIIYRRREVDELHFDFLFLPSLVCLPIKKLPRKWPGIKCAKQQPFRTKMKMWRRPRIKSVRKFGSINRNFPNHWFVRNCVYQLLSAMLCRGCMRQCVRRNATRVMSWWEMNEYRPNINPGNPTEEQNSKRSALRLRRVLFLIFIFFSDTCRYCHRSSPVFHMPQVSSKIWFNGPTNWTGKWQKVNINTFAMLVMIASADDARNVPVLNDHIINRWRSRYSSYLLTRRSQTKCQQIINKEGVTASTTRKHRFSHP